MCDPEPLAEKVLQLGFDRLHPVHVALSNHDMRLDRSIALIQLPDMHVMNLFDAVDTLHRSEEHTSELQSLMRISYAVFCLKKKTKQHSDKLNTSTTTTNDKKQN